VPTGRAETVVTSVEGGNSGGGRRESGSKGSKTEAASKVGRERGASYRDHRSEDSRQSRAGGSRTGSYRRLEYLDVQDVQEEKPKWDVADGKAEWDHGQGKEDGPW